MADNEDDVALQPAEQRGRDAAAKARALVDSIRSALAAGCTHYARDGRKLTTAKEILEAMLLDGQVDVAEPGAGPKPQDSDPCVEVMLYSTKERVRCNDVPVRLWVGQLRDGTSIGAAVAGIFLLEEKPSDERLAQFHEHLRSNGLDAHSHEPLTIEWTPGGKTTEHGAR